MVKQVREHKWSLDACCGCAKRQCLFAENEMVCTHTLYNMVWDGLLPIKVTELPEALKRKGRKSKDRENKKRYGTSISDRPEIAAQRMEEGHWEGDTVVGKRAGHEAVILTLLEKKTENYLAIRIPGKTSKAVMDAMTTLRAEYGQHFPQVFKTITVDNHGKSSVTVPWRNSLRPSWILFTQPDGCARPAHRQSLRLHP